MVPSTCHCVPLNTNNNSVPLPGPALVAPVKFKKSSPVPSATSWSNTVLLAWAVALKIIDVLAKNSPAVPNLCTSELPITEIYLTKIMSPAVQVLAAGNVKVPGSASLIKF